MKLNIKNIVLISCMMIMSISNSFAQFSAYKGPCGDFVICSENNIKVDLCKCDSENKDFQWTTSAYESAAGGVDVLIAAERRLLRNFKRDFRNAAKNEIEQRYGKTFPNFREAQLFFFDKWASLTLPENRPRVAYDNFHADIKEFKNNFQLVTTDLNVLEFRRREILDGNINQSEVGPYIVEGKAMNTINSIPALEQVKQLSQEKWNGLNDHLNPIISTNYSKFGGANIRRASLVCGAEKLSYKSMRYHLANQYVREYEKFDRKLKNTINANNQFRDFLVASDFGGRDSGPNGNGLPVLFEFINKGFVYFRSPADVVYRESRRLGRGSCDFFLPPPTPIETVKSMQALVNLGDATNDYLSENLQVRNAVNKYFEHYDYNKASQDCVNYLFQKITGNGDFAPNINDYKSKNTPSCREASAPNTAIDMQWKPSSIDAGYQGFQNIMAELNNIPQNHQKIGHVIKDILSANGKGLPNWMDDVLVGRYFNFRLVPVNATGVQIDFRNGFGANAWNDGLRDNDAVYNHIQRVEFVSVKLDLDTKQREILLNAADFVSQLFNFLNSNVDNPLAIDFGKDAVATFNEGGDVDFDCNDPQPDKRSFCKKVWYLDKDGDGYYAEMKEVEERPGSDWYENLTEKDCDDTRKCVKDNCEKVDWYLDNDGDGYYKEKKNDFKSCKPEGDGKWNMTSNKGEDCDDNKSKVHEANKNVGSFSIYKDTRQPGFAGSDAQSGVARDYLEGDLTVDSTIDLMNEFLSIENEGEVAKEVRIDRFRRIYNMSDNELFEQMERAAKLALRYQQFLGNGLGNFDFDESLQSNIDMISRFRNNSGGISEISGNTQSMLTQDASYQSYLGDLQNNIKSALNNVDNVNQISSLSLSNLNRPSFNTGANFFNVNSTWTINVSLENAKIDCEKFSGTLKVDIYDQFGLDNADMGFNEIPHPSAWKTRLLDGMWSWFILQRVQRPGGNYSPFINHFTDSIEFETTLN